METLIDWIGKKIKKLKVKVHIAFKIDFEI